MTEELTDFADYDKPESQQQSIWQNLTYFWKNFSHTFKK